MEDDNNMVWWCLDDYDDDDGAPAGWVGEATDHAALPVDGEQTGTAFELDDTLQHKIHQGLV